VKVQQIIIVENQARYILIDDKGDPVIPVIKYLKYIDNTGKSINTQKTYCYALKLYFDFLQEQGKAYSEITIKDLANFVGWLRSPYGSSSITPLKAVKAKRTERTVNLVITAVTGFYDYLFRLEEIQNDLVDKLKTQVFSRSTNKYKGFLHHLNSDSLIDKNILKLKEPRKKITILTKEEVEEVYRACRNVRDKLLIRLLFETGSRIGEALGLFIEDFVYDFKAGHRIVLKDRGELSNGARLKTGERNIYISQELIDLFDDYMYEVLDELDVNTNFVFVKLKGKNTGLPMEYQDIHALMKRLKEKTGIAIHSHLLRHTHATIFYRQSKDIKQVQERLGHSQIQTTMNMYLHPSDEDIRHEWEKAKHIFDFKEGK